MTKEDLVAAVATMSGASKKEVEAVLNAFQTVVIETVTAGDSVILKSFVKFSQVTRKASAARVGRNPRTGETLNIAAKPAAQVAKAVANFKL